MLRSMNRASSLGALTALMAVTTSIPTGCASQRPDRLASEEREESVAMLASVSPQRLRRDVETLAAFGTRHTLSETESDTRGIGAARRWTKQAFEEAADNSWRTGDQRVRVEFDSHMIPPDGRRIPREVEVVNVVATIPGVMPEARDRLYYVLSHLDSRASDPLDAESDAPGANDSASGVAMMIELMRVLSPMRLDSTIVLVATSGEEQGLYGARYHAQEAHERGRDIRAVLNNDTVGDPYGIFPRNARPGDPHHGDVEFARKNIRVFAEGVPAAADATVVRTISRLGAENDSPPRTLARYITNTVSAYPREAVPIDAWVIYRNDRFLRGGDHTPFVRLGYPAVRLTVPFENYDRQHQDVRVEDGVRYGDLPEYIDEDYLADVTRLNASVLVHLTNGPSSPPDTRVIVAELTNDSTLRWSESPEPDVAGYEVVWRETTAPNWQWVKDVGDVTEATIDLSKDNFLFGVRAYDEEGYRSPVAFPQAATE